LSISGQIAEGILKYGSALRIIGSIDHLGRYRFLPNQFEADQAGEDEMPLFFFDFTFDGITDTDDAGVRFPSLEMAYLETCRAALDISFEKLRARKNPHLDSVEILDCNRRFLMLIPFAEVLQPKPALPLGQRDFEQLVRSCRQQMARAELLRAEVVTELKSIQFTTDTMRANLARSRKICTF
jgi:hypothetical protein